MNVILLEDIPKLGKLGTVVKVKPGYARNYLLPKSKVKRATEKNIEEFKVMRQKFEQLQAEKLDEAQKLYAQLDGLIVQIVSKAGMDGRLFGSVNPMDVTAELNKLGFDMLKKKNISIPGGYIKHVGDYSVSILLHQAMTVSIKLSVLGEH